MILPSCSVIGLQAPVGAQGVYWRSTSHTVGSSSAEEHLVLGSRAIGMAKGCNHIRTLRI
jgi:hypothetical protein